MLTATSAPPPPPSLSRSVTATSTTTAIGGTSHSGGGGSGAAAAAAAVRGTNRLAVPGKLGVPHKLVKSISTPQFARQGMAAVAMPSRDDSVVDTRTPSPIPSLDSNGSPTKSGTTADAYKPDLSAEVTMLSTKLVNALNYQTNLDDALQACRHELEQSRLEGRQLRQEKQERDELVAKGVMVRRTVFDQQIAQLKIDLAREQAAREEAEKAKKQTEGELETLTTALFEEANTMVAAARKDSEAMEKRNSQLRGQLHDTELLLASQQEQLRDLKDNMEKMERASESDTYGGQRDPSMPTTPIHATRGSFEHMNSPGSVGSANVAPEHPLFFSQLLLPVLRHDVAAYNEFQDLLQLARRGMPHSRNNSNNMNSITSNSQTSVASTSASSPTLPGAFSFTSNSSPQPNAYSQGPALKESKFYKRTLVEDLEPTLRLDLAPGLSFLSRRTVLSSLLLGSLVVEPFLPQTKNYGPLFACSLCGESRKNEPYPRRHRFRTSEEESAQRYPLCDYCLMRVRAAGDFVGFLRMVRDGYWRGETEEEQNSAWEETVRLRERMFWARVGGGVVPLVRRDGPESPSTAAGVKSQRSSFEVALPVTRSPSKLVMVENAETKAEENGEDTDNEVVPIGDENDDDDAAAAASSPPSQIKGERVVSTASTIHAAEESTGITTPDDPAPLGNDAIGLQIQIQEQPDGHDDALTPSADAEISHHDFAAAATEQLQREAEATVPATVLASTEEDVLLPPATIANSTPRSRSQSSTKDSEAEQSISRPESPNEQSLDTGRPDRPASPSPDRRFSAVLARVQAMEAKARNARIPGSLE